MKSSMRTTIGSGRARRCMRRVAIALTLLLVPTLSAELSAHPMHTTFTTVTRDATGMVFRVRVFADDFALSVSQFVNKPRAVGDTVNDADAWQYVRARFAIVTAAGLTVAPVACGVRRDGDVYWVCFRAPLPHGVAPLRIQNALLTELHSDQVNIVQSTFANQRRTMLFNKNSAPALIGE
ncbi:MAG: hypothetical protein IT353_06390 [Gemmatimonadaceae bacterium]|nr:hypothetical protein [Gemmatimonadaceae bacterium]